MAATYQARWISKKQLETVRKSGVSSKLLVLDSFNGFLIIEPVGSNLGDGNVLTWEEADYELTPVWCNGSKAKLREARKLLGLEIEETASKFAEVAS